MLSDDGLKAAAKTALRLAIESARYRSTANIRANLGVTAAASTPKPLVVPQELQLPRTDQADQLTRAEIADYLARAGWDPDKARDLAAAELAVDFGHSLTSKHLQVLVDLIDEAPEQDQTALQLQTVDLLGRWLLRKRQAVGPDGRIVVGVRSLGKAKKIVAVWISDELTRRKTFESDETGALGSAHSHEGGEGPRRAREREQRASRSSDQKPAHEKTGLGHKQLDLRRYLDSAKLTARQRECISLLLEYGLGKTAIAQRLGIDRKTLDEHLSAAERKFELLKAKERADKNIGKVKPGSFRGR